MSDEFEQKLEAKSDYAGDTTSVSTPDIDAVPDAEFVIVTMPATLTLSKFV